MNVFLSQGRITVAEGSSSNRTTPQDIIDSNISGVSSGGRRTIIIGNALDLMINGFYEDTGWHYEMSDGSRFLKGLYCNWLSGRVYAGFRLSGFTASVDNWGHSWSFNEGDGGSVYWRNVVITTRTGARSDFSLNGDSTNYDIDGFTYDSKEGIYENTGTIFNTGVMRNINFIRTNHGVGGNGTLENFGHSGLLENGAENKIFPTENNYHFVKYKPYLESDGKRIASGFHTFSSSDGEKTIYFDDLDVPPFFDHTTDIVAYWGPGRIIGQRTFNVGIKNSLGNSLSDVNVLIKNTSDNSDSVRGVFSGEINQLVEVYNGQKTGGGGYTIPNIIKNYQFKNAYFFKYGKQINSILGIDMKAKEYVGNVFLLDDGSITEPNKATVETYTSIDTAAQFYDYAKSYLVDNYDGEATTIIARSGNTIDAGNYNVSLKSTGSVFTFDGTTITINASSWKNAGIITTGSINVEEGININGSTFSSLNLTKGQNLTNVKVTGTLTFNDNTPATFNLTNSTIGRLVNDGTGLLTFNSLGSIVTDFTDTEVDVVIAPTPSTMNLITSGRWAIYNNLGTFIESGTGNKTYNNAGTDTGIWTVIVHRKGYQAEKFSWVSDNDTTNDFAYSNTQVIRPEGGQAYSGSATPNVTTTTIGDKIISQIGNLQVESQEVLDSIQDYLNTDGGLDWLHTYENLLSPTWGVLSGISFFLNVEGFVYDSVTGTTPEAGIGGLLVSSASHSNVLTTNGGVIFASISEDEIIDEATFHSYLDSYTNKDNWKGSGGTGSTQALPTIELG